MKDVPMSVDKFHFINHVDSWCRENCDPTKIKELDNVNTESCEQTFKWVNKFTSVKAMNGPQFWMFFTYIFDLHNLSKEDKLRSSVNPLSEHRWNNSSTTSDYERLLNINADTNEENVNEENTLLESSPDVDIDVADKLDNMSLEPKKYVCEECGAKYKVPWTLKSHMTKKHSTKENVSTFEKIFICKECSEIFTSKLLLEDHEKVHCICPICKRQCISKSDFKRHLTNHK